MGYISQPIVEFETDAARMLEAMYEALGDTIAIQYGGSQLIHRVKCYRKNTNQWTSKANDITQTIRRYYSNTLSDADKQMMINLFLGVFRPTPGCPHIWDKEYATDTSLHLPNLRKDIDLSGLLTRHNTQWWDRRMKRVLPLALFYCEKNCDKVLPLDEEENSFRFDLYSEYYRPFELHHFSECFALKDTSNTLRDYMPDFCSDYSPFVVRDLAGKYGEEAVSTKSKTTSSFQSFFTSLASVGSGSAAAEKPGAEESDSESEGESESNSDEFEVLSLMDSSDRLNNYTPQSQEGREPRPNYSTFFPSSADTYGFQLQPLEFSELKLYSDYVLGITSSKDKWKELAKKGTVYRNSVPMADIELYAKTVSLLEESGLRELSVSQEDRILYETFTACA
eukprot:TRINITY_DN7345_c0_g1_i1.p2 TRINITY_DN7345_c0_g1~~TRINITY_DN7345_c0_g1_i1.p2  ORF type:complete len:395 (-),score=113.75 TRINITY_DN7345_c0_g1_i1:15-1199(-)